MDVRYVGRTMRMARMPWVGVGLVVLAAAWACSRTEPMPGVLMIAVQTDMSTGLGQGIHDVGFYVRDLDRNRTLFALTLPVQPDGSVRFPATLAVIGRSHPGASVRIRIVGYEGNQAHVMRDAVTTIPTDRTALLRLPLRWIDYGGASGPMPASSGNLTTLDTLAGNDFDVDPFGVVSYTDPNCLGEKTFIDGQCVDWKIDSSTLPDYNEAEVFGGGTSDGGGTCFDTETCFEQSTDLVVDESCVAPRPPGAFTLAIKMPIGTAGSGVCVGDGCFVPLDPQEAEGWRDDPRGVKLSPGTCKHALNPSSGVKIVWSSKCGTKAAFAPLCGPASTSGPGTDLPSLPPEDGSVVELASGDAPTDLVLDDANVYFLTRGAVVWRVDKNKPGSETKVITVPAVDASAADFKIAINAPKLDQLVVTELRSTNKFIRVFNADGGPTAQFPGMPSGNTITALAASATDVYWVDDRGSLFVCPLANCTGSKTFGKLADAGALIYEPTANVEFLTGTPAGLFSQVARANATPTDGGPLDITTVATSPGPVGSVAVEGGFVYWMVTSTSGAIYGTPSDGATAFTGVAVVSGEDLSSADPNRPRNLVANGGYLFWTNAKDEVRAAPAARTTGTLATTLATGQNGAQGIAVDAKYIYWSSSGDGKVRRLPRPATLKN